MIEVPQAQNTVAVVVTYHPDNGFAERLRQIAALVDRVLVVDNGSSVGSLTVVEQAVDVHQAELLKNGENLGIATALNQGLQWALSQGYRWALTFDQDSTPSPRYLEAMRAVITSYDAADRIAVVGAPFFDPRLRRVLNAPAEGGTERWVEVETVITSGSLLSLNVFQTLGLMRDAFFIDHVDDEYCLRARRRQYVVLETREPLLEHSIGAAREYRRWGRTFISPNYQPVRHYYMTRNFVALLREYQGQDLRWFRRSCVMRVKQCITMLLFEQHRAAKVGMMARGLFDGLRGKMGRFMPLRG